MKRLTILLSAAALMLTGATMTSCVKNDESESVRNIRDAKAAQLLALAELSSSQAEAALIAANADKMLKESEAAINNAEAALKQAQLEQDKVAIETAKLALEKAKATHQLEIDKMIADAEVKKQTSLKALKDFMDGLAASNIENVALKNLTGAYATEYSAWNTLMGDLIDAKVALSNAELGLADLENTKAKEIAEKEIIIASAESMITFLKTIDVSNKAKVQEQLDIATGKEKVATTAAATATKQNDFDKTLVTPANKAYTDAAYYNAVATVADAAVVKLTVKAVKSLEKVVALPDGTATKVVAAPVNANYSIVEIVDQDALTDLIENGGSDDIKAAATLLCDAAAKTANKAAYDKVLAAEDVQMKSGLVAAEQGAIAGIYTTQKQNLTTLLGGYADVPALIAAEEVKITTAKKAIADLSSIEDQEQLIAFSQGEVDRINTELDASEKQLSIYKAAIEAELKK